MKNRKGIIAICIVILVVIVGIAGYMYYKRTPTYTFSLIKTSVEKHDWDTFSKHVDTENIIGTGYDAFIQSAIEADEDMDDSMKGFVGGFAQMMKPAIVSAINEETKEWVKTGETKSEQNSNDAKNGQNAQQAADNMKKSVGFDQSKYKGVAYTKKEGDFSIVGVTIEDSQLGKEFTLDLKMRQLEDGTWQILSISNLKEYLDALAKARKEKLAEVNKPIQDEIDSRVSVKSVQASIVPKDSWGFSYALRLTVPVTINSDKDISKISGNLYVKDSSGKRTKFPVTATLTGSGDQTLHLSKDLNPFIGGEAKLIKADLNSYTITMDISKLTYTDGSTLELKKSLDEETSK